MAASSLIIGSQVLSLATGLSFLSGFLINVFIVAVNISEWKKRRPVSKIDKVITSLVVSKTVFQVSCVLMLILHDYLYRLSSLFLVLVILTSMYSSIWLSTLLSVLFCLKISTLQNAFFLRLKILVLNRVFHLIMAFLMVSISYALIFSLMIHVEIFNNSTQKWYNNAYMGLHISALIFPTTGPLFINFMSSVLLIIYLCNHVSRMSSERNRKSHLDTYYKTIKFTIFSFLFSAVYIILQQTYNHSSAVIGLLGYNFFSQISSTLHSIYLIYVTAKLRIQVSNMVHFLRRCGDLKAQIETVF
ncbi:taste receptor type 2 member 140-like [Eleutherodactylus coqui]|uniref:taste receptor type 2 member 140-like n=1 Tax=Eleutherodactylus coqui TaxID=57060 RepID=UPI0034637CCF